MARYTVTAVKKGKPRPLFGKGFTPYTTPTNPPPGTFDPALDAANRSSQRGLSDLLADTSLTGSRAGEDYQTAVNQANLQRSRGLADLATQLAQENENYGTNTQNLVRSYKNLAANQTDAARAAGVAEGGALAQALAKRNANQAIQQSALDVAHQRALDANTLATNRLNEDTNTTLAGLLTNYTRGVTDRDTQVDRAKREAGLFGQDTAAEEWYAAKQGGYVAPGKPANEYGTGASAVRKVTLGGHTYLMHPSGQLQRVRKGQAAFNGGGTAVGFG